MEYDVAHCSPFVVKVKENKEEAKLDHYYEMNVKCAYSTVINTI